MSSFVVQYDIVRELVRTDCADSPALINQDGHKYLVRLVFDDVGDNEKPGRKQNVKDGGALVTIGIALTGIALAVGVPLIIAVPAIVFSLVVAYFIGNADFSYSEKMRKVYRCNKRETLAVEVSPDEENALRHFYDFSPDSFTELANAMLDRDRSARAGEFVDLKVAQFREFSAQKNALVEQELDCHWGARTDVERLSPTGDTFLK